MDPFHLSKQSHEADNFLNHSDIELLVEGDKLPPLEYGNSTKNKKHEQTKNKHEVEIPRNYPRKLHNSKHPTTTKVKTVGEIRKKFETEQIGNWISILKSDENLIAKCNTSKFCLKKYKQQLEAVVADQRPVTKSCWDSVHKLLNHREFTYLVADGKKVRLSGCVDGKYKEVKYSLFKPTLKKRNVKSSLVHKTNESATVLDPTIIRKRGLLSTINVDFKPGPLSKKAKLNSTRYDYEEDLKLMNMPTVGIEVYPRIGSKLDSTACTALNTIRSSQGFVDAKWADFATSVLETDSDNSLPHTFVLPYENNQNRLLFRQDPDFKLKALFKHKSGDNVPVDLSSLESPLHNLDGYLPDDDVQKVVVNVLYDMLKCVSINELQDDIGVLDTDYVPVESKSLSAGHSSNSDGHKVSRKNRELSRLDVTVIDVSGDTRDFSVCTKEWCKLGCVCSSIATSCMLNEHCGKIHCMLSKCTCKFGKNQDNGGQHEIPNAVVANLQNQVNRYLAKEEQKFRRTVIKTKDDTIVIGASRRGQRLPKKYDDYVVSDSILEGNQSKRSLSTVNIHLNKLPSNLSIEPLCMVHGLYRCFCKGIMTHGILLNQSDITLRHDQLNTQPDTITQGQNNSTLQSCTNSPPILNKRQINKTKLVTSPIDSNVQKVTLKNTQPVNGKQKPKVTKNLNEGIKTVCKPVIKNTQHVNGKQKTKETNNLNEGIKTVCKPVIKNKPSDVLESPNPTTDAQNLSLEKFPANTSNVDKNDARTINGISRTSVLKCKTRDELREDAIAILQNPKKKIYCSIPGKVFNGVILLQWAQLIADFQAKDIFLWITQDPPYNVFVSKTHRLFSTKVFIPIIYGKPLKKNILLSNTYLEYILCCDTKACKYAALVGRQFAWEILCTFNNTSDQQSSQLTYPKITSVYGSYAEVSDNTETIENGEANDCQLKLEDMVAVETEGEGCSELGIKRENNGDNIDHLLCASNSLQENVNNDHLSYPSNSHQQNDPAVPSTSRVVQETPKYHWLVIYVFRKFDEFKELSRNFKITFRDLLEAMVLAERTGKTVKYPPGPLVITQKLPQFGVYAIPGNGLRQVFLGPYIVGEKANIKTFPDPVKEPFIKGVWTKEMVDPRLVIWRNHRTNKQSVLYIGKPFTTFRLPAPSQICKKNIFNFLKLDPRTAFANEMAEASSTSQTLISEPADSTQTTQSMDSDNHDDDVVYIPNDDSINSIIELSDVEDES